MAPRIKKMSSWFAYSLSSLAFGFMLEQSFPYPDFDLFWKNMLFFAPAGYASVLVHRVTPNLTMFLAALPYIGIAFPTMESGRSPELGN